MKISSLNVNQKQYWDMIESTLLQYGWHKSDGILLQDETQVEYKNAEFTLILSFTDDGQNLMLILEDTTNKNITLLLPLISEISAILEVLIEYQDRVNNDTYKEMLNQLLLMTPDIQILRGEEYIPLKSDIA